MKGETTMTRLALAIGVLAIGFAAATPASADFAVVKFKDTGACRTWLDRAAKPSNPYQVLWAKVPTWEVGQAKGAWAIKHHWCKVWY
jgi:hypothetical protein